jgi:hypothetical protein
MKTARPLPDDFQDRPFTVADASRAGVSHKRLRHRSLLRMGKGIRSGSSTAALPLNIRVRPFIEVNERCAASHLTAAELLVLPRRQQKGTPDMFHVIRPEGSAHLNRPHVIVHRMKLFTDEVTTVDGIPVTTPERTWLDMAELLSVDELVVMGDSCVRMPRAEFEDRDMPLCSLADLQRMIDRHKGKRGLRKAKEAVKFIRVGADSPQETLLRLAMVRAGLPEPELNVPSSATTVSGVMSRTSRTGSTGSASSTKASITVTKGRSSGTLHGPKTMRRWVGLRSAFRNGIC